MSQDLDPSEAPTVPYDPNDLTPSIDPETSVESAHDTGERADLSTSDRSSPEQLNNQVIQNPAQVVRRYLDVYTAAEDVKLDLVDRSPADFSQRSTLTDTQFSFQFSTPLHRTPIREYEEPSSAQFAVEPTRFTNPINDLGSQNSIKTDICTANFDVQHRRDIIRPKRCNSAVADDGPELKSAKYKRIIKRNSDFTDFTRGFIRNFSDKHRAMVNIQFNHHVYPAYVQPKSFSEKMSEAQLILAKDAFVEATDPEEFLNNLPPVHIEQLKRYFSVSSDEGSEEISPVRYPSPQHQTNSGSSLSPTHLDCISSDGKVSNMSDEVRAYLDLHPDLYEHEERYGVYPSSDPGNDYAFLGDFEHDDYERELTPEIEESSVPRAAYSITGVERKSQPTTSNEPSPHTSNEPAPATPVDPSAGCEPHAPQEPAKTHGSDDRNTVSEKPTKAKKKEKGKERAQTRPSRREPRSRAKQRDPKVMLSSGIDDAAKKHYNVFLDQMGAKTNSIEECTVYIQAVVGKHTIGSSCAQILGKFIADTEWLDACVKQGKIIDHPPGNAPNTAEYKGKKLYFSKHCGLTNAHIKLIAEALNAKAVLKMPTALDDKLVVVTKGKDDDTIRPLIALGYKPIAWDKFLKAAIETPELESIHTCM